MSLTCVAHAARIVLFAIPHPASRRIAAYLQTAIAASDPAIDCVLATTPERELAADEVAFHLCSAASDTVELAVMADMDASPDVLAAHALVADLDERWRALTKLSMDSLLEEPRSTVEMLLASGGLRPNERVLFAAAQGLPSLRSDLAIYDHPLAFLAAVEPPPTRHGSTTPAPRMMLALTGPSINPMEEREFDAEGWTTIRMTIGDAFVADAETIGSQDRVHLHHVSGALGLCDLLDGLIALLAPGGLLSGEERDAIAAESVVGQLTLRHNHRGVVFRLSGREWRAAPRSWWR